jgi:hypothetical protein
MGGRDLGRVFDEVPELYDRVRPGYPTNCSRTSRTRMGDRAARRYLSVLRVGRRVG